MDTEQPRGSVGLDELLGRRDAATENLMKLETEAREVKEIYMDHGDFNVTVTTWSNHEGASMMVHGKDLQLRFAGAFRWDEIDVMIAALSTARAV